MEVVPLGSAGEIAGPSRSWGRRLRLRSLVPPELCVALTALVASAAALLGVALGLCHLIR